MMSEMNFEQSTWRLIHTPPARGSWNMAVDEAILEAIGQGRAPGTLRLYSWVPPCVSLGYAQAYDDVDEERLKARGWDIVRRPTGGRALLHTDEITYAVIVPNSEPRLAGGVLESYQRISAALLKALENLGLPARSEKMYDLPEEVDRRSPVCFEVPSNYEITVAEKKLVGSAQARKSSGILQHGALPLVGDITRLVQVLRVNREDQRETAEKRMRKRTGTVEELLGRRVTWEEAAAALRAGFEELLNLSFEQQELSEWETNKAEQLMLEKHNSPNWIKRI